MKFFSQNKPAVKTDDITLMVQGPFNFQFLRSLSSCTIEFKNIIYSTWSNSEVVGYFKHLPEIQIAINELPDTTNIKNISNLYYQVCGTFEGLKNVKTKYTLKHRADENYSNLHLVIKKFSANKLHSSNIFFREIGYSAYHISDHLFFAETRRLKEAFWCLKEYLERNYDYLNILDGKHPPEQIIGLFYLATHDLKIETLLKKKKKKKFVYKVMKKYFDVFDIENLKPYAVRHNHLNRTIHDLRAAEKASEAKYISKISDIK